MVAMYVNIPVRENTKKLLDQFREVTDSKSYDETVQKLVERNSFLLIADLEGIIEGCAPFKRDKRARNFD
ncbi:MAG: hypothetical protein AABX01_00480 [Candidatus Micrarchaeota archaeon]